MRCEAKRPKEAVAAASNPTSHFVDLHEESQAIYRNYFCTGCGAATMNFRMAQIGNLAEQRLCQDCEADGIPPGTVQVAREEEAAVHAMDGTSPLGGTMPYALYRSERQKMCVACGQSTRNFSMEMDQGDPAQRVCLDCEAALAAQLDKEDQQGEREATPPRRASTPRYDRVSPGRTQGSLTAAGCIKRAMRCSRCLKATKLYTIESLQLDPSTRVCIECLSANE